MKLYCIGIGPGGEEQMTLRAVRALEKCDCVAGYGLYLDLIENLISGKERIESGMTREVLRCKAAVEAAKQGKTVAVVSSGDAGVYGMAGLLLELCEHEPDLEVEVIPGITAACSGGAVLGSPLTCDFACISLSDLLTPWDKIEQRLRGAAQGDFCIALYNPSSKKRTDHLRRAEIPANIPNDHRNRQLSQCGTQTELHAVYHHLSDAAVGAGTICETI